MLKAVPACSVVLLAELTDWAHCSDRFPATVTVTAREISRKHVYPPLVEVS
jgi:hypothetical protein